MTINTCLLGTFCLCTLQIDDGFLYKVRGPLSTAQCTVHCKLQLVYYTLHTTHYKVPRILNTLHTALHATHYKIHRTQYSLLYTLQNTQCTLHTAHNKRCHNTFSSVLTKGTEKTLSPWKARAFRGLTVWCLRSYKTKYIWEYKNI